MTKGSHVLDNPVWHALNGPQESMAVVHRKARRFRPDIAVFNAIEDGNDLEAWNDLKELRNSDGIIVLTGTLKGAPEGWETVGSFGGYQMSGENVEVRHDPEFVPLGNEDVPEMIDLVRRTEPGPFYERTIEFGGYLGARVDGKLVAMAGRRMNPPGWVEISAVCTDPDYRGRGYASRLVRAVGALIRDAGDIPFLHVAGTNENAIRLYKQMGFTVRDEPNFLIAKPIEAN